MKTKTIYWILIVSIMMISVLECNNCQAARHNETNDDHPEGVIESMLRSFYASYLTECSRVSMSNEKLDSIKKAYCTVGFLNHLNRQYEEFELDWDPFIAAQLCDTEWLKSLTITKDNQRNNLYNVSFFRYPEDKIKVTIKMIVVKESDNYKIDYVRIESRIDERYETLSKDSTIILKE